MKYSQAESRDWVDLAGLCTTYGLDALAIIAYLAVLDVVILSGGGPPVVRAVLAVPFVVFLPGYALTAALFPRSVDRFGTARRHGLFERASAGALTLGERAVLSFGSSLAVLPLLGVVQSVGSLGYSATTSMGMLNLVVLVGLAVGVVRRVRAPRRERISFAPETWVERAWGRLTHGSRFETALTVALVVGAVAATSSLGLAFVAPADGESYTTAKLLTEGEGGELVTDGYPNDLAPDESGSVVLGVENHEGTTTDYTVVTELQSVETGDGSVTVLEERELDRATRTVADGDTWLVRQSFEPELGGDQLRLVFLVYQGAAPEDPTAADAYRSVHLSVTVSEDA